MKKIVATFLALLLSATASAQAFDVKDMHVRGTLRQEAPSAQPGCTNIMTYGGVANGQNDNSAAFDAAVAATKSTASFTGSISGTTLTVTGVSYGTLRTGQVLTGNGIASSVWISALGTGTGGVGTYTLNTSQTVASETISAGYTDNACIYFPPGTYLFSAGLNYTLPSSVASITIKGAGAGVSNLYWPGGGGLEIQYQSANNSAHLADLSIYTGASNYGNGLYLVQNSTIANPANTAQSDIINVTVSGKPDTGAYWQKGISLIGVSNVNLFGVNVVGGGTTGTGLYLYTTSSVPGVVYNVTSSTFNYLQYGLYYGPYVQGVSVSQCNFTGGLYGIYAPSGNTGTDQLYVAGTQFNVSGAAIYELTQVSNSDIVGNLFIVQNNSQGINLAQSGYYAIVGNSFNPNGGTNANAIVINNSISPGIITGNNIFGMGATGITLQSGSQYVNVQSNVYSGNGTNVVNSGTNNTVGGGSQ
ncbi:right-handed parallel beta-helix repeat-containing protein [Paraburkholderia sp. Ac-20347]|uniref:right-handed parallel beta-helix repeat-containing protein n=1 Tax=Paraburkholderia sp. Ac-20347 TaxID=2703892 RepID=UPI00198102F2|nr:right-handed parallel beta-helix repeat-containing protein [Paraburkholderia sp. Ac-20347]MBN3812228.1 right-handed parallel beta-helix repeat-containing protein [Paraburkholderia sp. Ac-20347]